MKMKALDRTKLILGGLVLVAIVVAIAGFVLAVQPQQSKQSSLDDQIATQQVELANLHTRVHNGKPDLQAAELFQLYRAMPDTVDQAGIVLTLAQLAERAHVTIVSVQPSTTVTLTDGAQAVPVAVVLGGTWSQVAAFLAALRSQVKTHGQQLAVAGRLFDIDQIQVGTSQPGSASSGPQAGPIEVHLGLNAFVYGTPPPPTTPSATTTTSTTPSTSGSEQAAGTTGGS
jgi:hypothetical protein